MRIPVVAGIETEYGIAILGAPRPDPIYASKLLLRAYRELGHPLAPCEWYVRAKRNADTTYGVTNEVIGDDAPGSHTVELLSELGGKSWAPADQGEVEC